MENLEAKIGLENNIAFAIYSLYRPLRTSSMECMETAASAARAWMFL